METARPSGTLAGDRDGAFPGLAGVVRETGERLILGMFTGIFTGVLLGLAFLQIVCIHILSHRKPGVVFLPDTTSTWSLPAQERGRGK